MIRHRENDFSDVRSAMTSKPSAELAACPFCGGAAIRRGGFIECGNCSAQGPTDREAVTGWNTRASSQAMLVKVIADILDCWSGYATPEMDAAITAMQSLGLDRWSMQASMEKSAINANVALPQAMPVREIFPEEDWSERDTEIADWFNSLTGKPDDKDWDALMAIISAEQAMPVEREKHLEQVIRETIDALERNSTSAPVVECLKAALIEQPQKSAPAVPTGLSGERPPASAAMGHCAGAGTEQALDHLQELFRLAPYLAGEACVSNTVPGISPVTYGDLAALATAEQPARDAVEADIRIPPNCDEHSYRRGWDDGYNTAALPRSERQG